MNSIVKSMKKIFNYTPKYKIVTSDADLSIINASKTVFGDRVISNVD